MASPLAAYVNSYLLLENTAAPTVVNGRIVTGAGQKYVVECFLTRMEEKVTSTGADYLPSDITAKKIMPGVGGEVYMYRGYGLRYVAAPAGYVITSGGTGLTGWIVLRSATKPSWIASGATGYHLQGIEPVKYMRIERPSGVYGGVGIDAIVSENIGGIPILVRSGDIIS